MSRAADNLCRGLLCGRFMTAMKTGGAGLSVGHGREEELVDAGVVVELGMEGGDELPTLAGGDDMTVDLGEHLALGC